MRNKREANGAKSNVIKVDITMVDEVNIKGEIFFNSFFFRMRTRSDNVRHHIQPVEDGRVIQILQADWRAIEVALSHNML